MLRVVDKSRGYYVNKYTGEVVTSVIGRKRKNYLTALEMQAHINKEEIEQMENYNRYR